jgi:hypothetical protein
VPTPDPLLLIRSLGEAHCYVAVVKADGLTTTHEKARAPFHARRSQRQFDLLRSNERIAETVGADVRAILNGPPYADWTAEQHLDEGLRLLREALAGGARAVPMTAAKLQEDLHALAYLDGYDLNESRFVQRVVQRLRELR